MHAYSVIWPGWFFGDMGFDIFRCFLISKLKKQASVLICRCHVFGDVYISEELSAYEINSQLNFTNLSKISTIRRTVFA